MSPVNTFEIYFAGLICFIEETTDDPQNKSHAVLIAEPMHKPFITMNGRTDPLTNDVTFPSLPIGPAPVRPYFAAIPSLAKYTVTGTARDKAAKGIRIALPKGDLTIASYFPRQSLYSLGGVEVDQQDVGELTVLLVTTPNTTVDVSIGGKPPTKVNSNAFILIENAAKHLPTKPGEHWKLHRLMTTAKTDSDIADLTVLKTAPNAPVDHTVHSYEAHDALQKPTAEPADSLIVVATQTQCSNSQWP